MARSSRRVTHDAPIRVVMMPKDTNALGSIFGGVILSYLDLAAGEHARRVAPEHLFVTKILREVDFIAPVRVGDTVSYYTETVSVGKSSIVIRVRVEAERGVGKRQVLMVTEAEVVMVAIDAQGRATPIISKPTLSKDGASRTIEASSKVSRTRDSSQGQRRKTLTHDGKSSSSKKGRSRK